MRYSGKSSFLSQSPDQKLIHDTTQTGSGSFTATDGPTITITPTTTRTRSTTTIEVYVSYCPDPALAGGLMNLGMNFSTSDGGTYHGGNGQTLNLTDPALTVSSTNGTSSDDNPLCNVCSNSVGICCPPTVSCENDSGKCPEMALRLSGNTINGYLIAEVMNSTAPVAGRRKVRALPRRKSDDATAAKNREKKKGRRERREF